MKTLLNRLFGWLRPRQTRKVKPSVPDRRRPQRKPVRGIEPLENRVAPASLINAYSISYQDLDGDQVVVKFSKPILAGATEPTSTILSDIFKFSNGTSAVSFGTAGPQYLQLIDLTQTPTVNFNTFLKSADGTSITVTATKSADNQGDDLTNIGVISASGIALGKVDIDGDLSQIDAGRGGPGGGVKSLTVNSLYKQGTATQPTTATDTAAQKLESRIAGGLGALTVKTDLYGYVHVVDGTAIFTDTTLPGRIGTVFVGGSLRGASAVAAASDNTGTIEAARNITSIVVAGVNSPTDPNDLAGLVGGGGKNSGSIIAAGGVGSVTVTDSLTGGGGQTSGALSIGGALGSLKIGGTVTGGIGASSGSVTAGLLTSGTVGGDVTGGTASGSGALRFSDVTKLTLNGKLAGGAGADAGSITVSGAITSLLVKGDVTGAGGTNSGSITSGKFAPSIILGGKLSGGTGFHSGMVHGINGLGVVKIAGDLTGGDGDRSGTVLSEGRINSVSAGKLVGGVGPNSGGILAGFDPALPGGITTVTLAQGLQGGTGIGSGSIVASKFGTITIGSASSEAGLTGGAGDFSGGIFSQGSIGSVTMSGAIAGGAGDHSGAIEAYGSVTSITVSKGLSGSAGDFSGTIRALEIVTEEFTGSAGNLGTVKIGGAITGSTGASSGVVEAHGNLTALSAGSLSAGAGVGSGAVLVGSGFLASGNANSIAFTGGVTSTTGSGNPLVQVDGSLLAFSAASLNDAKVAVGGNLGSASVRGDVIDSTISALGQLKLTPTLSNVAIGVLTVRGNVSGSNILAGYATDGSAANADVSIGTVTVNGTWQASNLVAGVEDLNHDGFGNSDDRVIPTAAPRAGSLSSIASIIVKGGIIDSTTDGDRFAFTARKITAMQVGTSLLAFDTRAGNQSLAIPGTTDTLAREIAV